METQNKQITCFNCGAKVDEAKRWYHGDQDDLVCLACAEKLKHTDTAYAGTSVAEMEVEKVTERGESIPSINTADGEAFYVRTDIEDENEKWEGQNLTTKDGFWIIHNGNEHYIYQIKGEQK